MDPEEAELRSDGTWREAMGGSMVSVETADGAYGP